MPPSPYPDPNEPDPNADNRPPPIRWNEKGEAFEWFEGRWNRAPGWDKAQPGLKGPNSYEQLVAAGATFAPGGGIADVGGIRYEQNADGSWSPTGNTPKSAAGPAVAPATGRPALTEAEVLAAVKADGGYIVRRGGVLLAVFSDGSIVKYDPAGVRGGATLYDPIYSAPSEAGRKMYQTARIQGKAPGAVDSLTLNAVAPDGALLLTADDIIAASEKKGVQFGELIGTLRPATSGLAARPAIPGLEGADLGGGLPLTVGGVYEGGGLEYMEPGRGANAPTIAEFRGFTPQTENYVPGVTGEPRRGIGYTERVSGPGGVLSAFGERSTGDALKDFARAQELQRQVAESMAAGSSLNEAVTEVRNRVTLQAAQERYPSRNYSGIDYAGRPIGDVGYAHYTPFHIAYPRTIGRTAYSNNYVVEYPDTGQGTYRRTYTPEEYAEEIKRIDDLNRRYGGGGGGDGGIAISSTPIVGLGAAAGPLTPQFGDTVLGRERLPLGRTRNFGAEAELGIPFEEQIAEPIGPLERALARNQGDVMGFREGGRVASGGGYGAGWRWTPNRERIATGGDAWGGSRTRDGDGEDGEGGVLGDIRQRIYAAAKAVADDEYKRRLAGLPPSVAVPFALDEFGLSNSLPLGFHAVYPDVEGLLKSVAKGKGPEEGEEGLLKLLPNLYGPPPPPDPMAQLRRHERREQREENFAGGGKMIAPEEIVGVGRFTGKPYFRLAENMPFAGRPEMLTIKPLPLGRRVAA